MGSVLLTEYDEEHDGKQCNAKSARMFAAMTEKIT